MALVPTYYPTGSWFVETPQQVAERKNKAKLKILKAVRNDSSGSFFNLQQDGDNV
jgi:hypothetical protein